MKEKVSELINTCLLYSLQGNFESNIVQYFLNNTNINQKFDNGMYPLHFACNKKDIKLLHMFLDKNADVNVKNNDKNTPLHLSVLMKWQEGVSFLLQNGADPNIINNIGLKAVELSNDESIRNIFNNSKS